MDSADDEFIPLSELTAGMNKCRVHACVLPNDIDQFEDQLVEGDVYALSNFTVEDTRESYMICSNELTIYFGGQTVVEEIEDSDLIPLHSFEFVNFKDLRSSGRDLGVTLYGDIACGFAKDMLEKGQEASDATGTMNLMIFCEVAEELVGVSAEELVDEIEDDDEWYSLPDELEDLLGSTHTFKVFDKYCSGSFSVMSIMDDVSVPVPGAATTQCKEELGDVSVPVPRAGITQCKEEMDDVSVPVPGAATTQCKEDMDDVSVPVPRAATTQCKEELDNVSVPVPRAATTQCKEELDDVSVLVPGAAITQCKEEHVPEGSANAALPTPATAQAMEEEIVHEESTTMAEAAPATTTQIMEETVHEGSATMAEGRSKSTRLQKPNKRLRGDDWIN
nr:unnamed protein product [Digitaria exilis]